MAEYWCRFIDNRGRVLASEKLNARNDAEAVAKARAIVLEDKRDSFELWDGARPIDIARTLRSARASC
jgi:hypothetical protein